MTITTGNTKEIVVCPVCGKRSIECVVVGEEKPFFVSGCEHMAKLCAEHRED